MRSLYSCGEAYRPAFNNSYSWWRLSCIPNHPFRDEHILVHFVHHLRDECSRWEEMTYDVTSAVVITAVSLFLPEGLNG
ncbi:hypothetical protein MTP99_018450 [Tenebrio molitor]|nr:hypothetical protein MTP99_018450 [Tenebrio molitor]